MRSAGATYGLENGFLEGALLFPPVRKTASCFEFSLCLSRACLGKMFVFIYKWLNNAVFRRRAISWRAGRRLGSTTSLTARSCPPGATGARSSYVLPFDTRTVLLLLLLLFVVSAYVLLTRRLPVCLPRSTRALVTACSATAMRFVGFALTAAPPASAHRTVPSVHWCETTQKTPFLEPFHTQSHLINL